MNIISAFPTTSSPDPLSQHPIQLHAKSPERRSTHLSFSRQPLYIFAAIVASANIASLSNVGSNSRRKYRLASERRRATSGTLLMAHLPRNKEVAFLQLHECALGLVPRDHVFSFHQLSLQKWPRASAFKSLLLRARIGCITVRQ